MSLINDMLRELDRRGVDPALPAAAVVSMTAPPRRRGRVFGWVAAMAALLALAWLAVSMWRQPAPLAADVAGTDAVAAVQQNAADVPPTPPAAAALATDSRPVGSDPGPPTTGEPSAVQPESLQHTDDAVVVAVDASNAPIARRDETPHDFTRGVDQRPPPSRPVPSASRPASQRANNALADPTLPVTAAPVAIVPDSAALPLLSIQRVRDPAADPDTAQLLQQADALLTARRDDEAAQLLQRVLERAPAHTQARLLLAGTLVERGRLSDAIVMLETGLAQAPRESALAERLGRLYLQQGDPARATAVLAQALPTLAEHPNHHALLALAWQQAGQPAQSAPIYQALLRLDGRVGAWWLGLALARDAQGDQAAARAAFTEAERLGGLEDSVLAYVRQRIDIIKATAP